MRIELQPTSRRDDDDGTDRSRLSPSSSSSQHGEDPHISHALERAFLSRRDPLLAAFLLVSVCLMVLLSTSSSTSFLHTQSKRPSSLLSATVDSSSSSHSGVSYSGGLFLVCVSFDDGSVHERCGAYESSGCLNTDECALSQVVFGLATLHMAALATIALAWAGGCLLVYWLIHDRAFETWRVAAAGCAALAFVGTVLLFEGALWLYYIYLFERVTIATSTTLGWAFFGVVATFFLVFPTMFLLRKLAHTDSSYSSV